MKTFCVGLALVGFITAEYWLVPMGLGFACLFLLIDWLAERWDEDDSYL